MYNRIEELCQRDGVNITQMCKEAEVPRGNLTELKKGRTANLSSRNLKKIADYFNVSIEYFLADDTPTTSISNVSNSQVVAGNRGSVSIGNNLTDQEEEVLRIFRSLSIRKKTAALTRLYELEEE